MQEYHKDQKGLPPPEDPTLGLSIPGQAVRPSGQTLLSNSYLSDGLITFAFPFKKGVVLIVFLWVADFVQAWVRKRRRSPGVEGEERGLDQGKSACPSEACPLPEWGRCWESRAPSTDIFFQMRDRPAPTGLPSKPLLWTLGQPSSHPLKAPS